MRPSYLYNGNYCVVQDGIYTLNPPPQMSYGSMIVIILSEFWNWKMSHIPPGTSVRVPAHWAMGSLFYACILVSMFLKYQCLACSWHPRPISGTNVSLTGQRRWLRHILAGCFSAGLPDGSTGGARQHHVAAECRDGSRRGVWAPSGGAGDPGDDAACVGGEPCGRPGCGHIGVRWYNALTFNTLRPTWNISQMTFSNAFS